MRAIIDKAGRVVVPKHLRDQIGLVPGEVEVTVDGAALRIEPVASSDVIEVDGVIVIPPSGRPLSRADVDCLRRAGQR